MLQELCNNLNQYYLQFSKGNIENPLTIRPIRYNDELANDSYVFYNDDDKNKYEELLCELIRLNEVKEQFLKEQQFENASNVKEQIIECINRIEALIHRGSLTSKQIFTLTKDGSIVYINKKVINGSLFKKFFNIK
jgi:hypothetical protein